MEILGGKNADDLPVKRRTMKRWKALDTTIVPDANS